MKPRIALSIMLAAATWAGTALAQAGPAPRTRADVEAETRAWLEAHLLVPSNDSGDPYRGLAVKSTKTIEDRREETLAARRNGDLRVAGDAADVLAERRALSAPSTRTRAERQAETRAAAATHQLAPAGEGPDAPRR
jgi:hypothetical protein